MTTLPDAPFDPAPETPTEGPTSSESASLVPRLDVLLAGWGAAVALLTMVLESTHDLNLVLPAWTITLLASALGGLVGAFLRWYLGRLGARTLSKRDWLIPAVVWLLGALAIAVPLNLASYAGGWDYPRVDYLAEGVALGMLIGTLSFPTLVWLVLRARRAARARRGSIVGNNDYRSIIGAFATSLALAVFAITLIAVTGAPSHVQLWLTIVLWALLLVQGCIFVAAHVDCRKVWRLGLEADDLDEVGTLGGGAGRVGQVAPIDMGIGDELYGQAASQSGYRQAARASASLVGFAPAASSMLRRARLVAGVQFGLIGLLAVLHLGTV